MRRRSTCTPFPNLILPSVILLFFRLLIISNAFSIYSQGTIQIYTINHELYSKAPSQYQIVLQLSKNDSNQQDYNSTPYRSIGEVVGGLHGGKYQFGSTGGYNFDDSSFSGQGSTITPYSEQEDETEDDLPNWAKQMKPPCSSSMTLIETLIVPSNSNPMDGMTYSVSVNIKNEERTWEKFYAKIMKKDDETNNEAIKPFYVTPKRGDLAPRGGASNVCDASQPYLDNVNLHIIHDPKQGAATTPPGCEWWLVAGTEEEKWYYKLKMED